MKTVVFQADAEAEMIEAAAYYEAQQCDLGRRFLAGDLFVQIRKDA